MSEVNIVEPWQQLLAKYLFFMPKSFRDIDPATLERRDTPAGFRVFRKSPRKFGDWWMPSTER